MPSKKDLAWLGKQGGRTVTTNGGEEKPDEMLDGILSAETKGMKLAAFKRGAGIAEPAAQPAAPPAAEALANTIVTQSMKVQEHYVGQLNLETANLRKEIAEISKSGAQTQVQLLSEMYARINDKQEAMDKTARDAAAAGAPPDVFTTYFKVKEQLEKIAPPPTSPAPAPGPDGAIQLQITQMKLEHDERMAQMTADNARQDKQWQLTLLQFQEESKRNWAEYGDKKNFRQDGMSGLQDLVSAVTSGIQVEQGGGGEPGGTATISNFACQQCQTPIAVPPGAATVTCSNPECLAQYKVD